MKKISFLSILLLFSLFLIPIKANASSLSYIYVDVKGCVNNPGVYRLEENSRCFQAIELAGGLRSESNTRDINLAMKLVDELVIYIPSINEVVEENNSLININEATVNELMLLNGIGATIAENIINYRETQGPFLKKEDIMNVSSIKQATYEKIKDFITV